MEVHVVEARRAAANQLRDPKPRTDAHVLGDEVVFERLDALEQPRPEREIVGIVAHQRHRQMRVRVDEARQHDAIVALEHAIGTKPAGAAPTPTILSSAIARSACSRTSSSRVDGDERRLPNQ